MWTLEKPWYIAAGISVMFVLVVVVAGLWMIGELVHMALEKTAQLPIRIVDFIDKRTPDGTVGLIGFLLLFLGFAFQLLGTYLSGQPPAG